MNTSAIPQLVCKRQYTVQYTSEYATYALCGNNALLWKTVLYERCCQGLCSSGIMRLWESVTVWSSRVGFPMKRRTETSNELLIK